MANSIIPLFLSQSYQDAWADYMRAMTVPNFSKWDYVILTASNEQQAEGFRMQIEERLNAGFLPKGTHFAVLPDPDGKRVGSGGATLNVIRYIAEQTGKSAENAFEGLRILVIHSGGDSKRVPQYSALGKLFSPVPHELPNGRASTLFDEFMIAMASVPSRIREGMLLLSGDVLLLFNPLLIDYSGEGAAAISFKEHVETGKNHGVFLSGEDGNVAQFLHKQTVETLKAKGAVNQQECVDIDTGAVIFSTKMLQALYSLISENGQFSKEAYDRYVNDIVRLSLYGDFFFPLASDSTLEAFYLEKPEGDYSPALTEARTKVWEVLRPFRMKLLRLAPTRFIHFGTTREIMHLMSEDIEQYSYLGWNKCAGSSIEQERAAGYNSVLSSGAECGKNCYLEVSVVHPNAVLGDNVLLSYVDIENETIPSDVVLHGLKQKDGCFVARIYGILDNPKEYLEDGCSFLGSTLKDFILDNKIDLDEIWDTSEHSLWQAKLYPACDTIREAVAAALNLYELVQGRGNLEEWLKSRRVSLCAGFNQADSKALIAWDKRMSEFVQMDKIAKLIDAGRPVSEALDLLKGKTLTKIQREWLAQQLSVVDYGKAARLHYYIGSALGDAEGEEQITECFKVIGQSILQNNLEKLEVNKNCHIVCDEHTVQLPLRVNWGGGWSDTPPYCNEHGGTVLNAAIMLDGKLPVEVTLKRLDEKKIVFESRDMDIHGEFHGINALQSVGDPYDPFVLQKAALLACGIIPSQGGDLEKILTALGGGFSMDTEVTDVPKGSGLGTSSILAAACVKALFEFMGIEHTQDDLYSHVLCMEQIMSTGGGWQDQVGGLSNGVKYITTMPGLTQEIKVQQIEIPQEAWQELQERFALIYTGQRRLARNLLRDVVGRYIGNEPDALYALNEIQRVAALMRFELERGHVDDFAKLLSEHWELSKKLDSGSTNTLIDQIFNAVDDLIDGRMICGAGGGGFLQVILKKGITAKDVHDRLKSVFQDSTIDVWDCRLI
ncbi:MAG: bifunctional fucokinase/L-fucose-1-P-guanylyltransferase [Lachnospiraceae bacterium]|nr:bifunctional fucokinase/L-fucose-1-P-guanylyltransferase [Lachnospiraceae bacterium]